MSRFIAHFLASNITAAYTGSAMEKFMAIMKLAVIPGLFAGLSEYVTGWVIDNRVFMSFIFTVVMVDALFGAIVHYIKKDFSFKDLSGGFFKKMAIVIVGYVVFEMIHQIVKDLDFGGALIKATIQLMTLFYPLGSFAKSCHFLSGGKYPPLGFMERLKNFNADLDINHFNTKKNENPTTDAPAELPGDEQLP